MKFRIGDFMMKAFLSGIVTGDETWIHYFEPLTKGESGDWHHPTSLRKKFMATSSAGKVMDSWPTCSGFRKSDFGSVPRG